MRSRFVIDELGRRDGNALKILRFEMQKKQDELLRLTVRLRPNQKRVDQTQHRSIGTDGECQRKDRNGRKAPLLEQLTQSESKIFKHSQSKALRLGIH